MAMDPSAVFMGKAGFVLFALGLVLGVVIPKLRNGRMGLSAHLTAVQTGPALIAFAVFWPYLSVPAAWTCGLVVALVGSAYALVAGITLAAATGASEALPIAGAGFKASPGQERIVSLLVRGSSVVLLLACLIVCFFALTNG